MSSKSKIAKKQIQLDLVNEQMTKFHRENISAKRWCKECNDWTVANFLLNGTLAPCTLCLEKRNRKIDDQKEMNRRAEMYRKATPVTLGKSFAEMLKK